MLFVAAASAASSPCAGSSLFFCEDFGAGRDGWVEGRGDAKQFASHKHPWPSSVAKADDAALNKILRSRYGYITSSYTFSSVLVISVVGAVTSTTLVCFFFLRGSFLDLAILWSRATRIKRARQSSAATTEPTEIPTIAPVSRATGGGEGDGGTDGGVEGGDGADGGDGGDGGGGGADGGADGGARAMAATGSSNS